jgi:hypothetical protein
MAPSTIRRRLRIALAVIAALCAAMAGGWWYLDWSAERDFQAALAETDALDPGWRLEDILAARPPIPDERNAYVHLLRVQPALRGFMLGERLEKALELPPNVRLHPGDAAALRKRMEALADVRRAAHQLKDMPDGRRNGDYDPTTVRTSLEGLQDLRIVAYFLHLDTVLRTYDGDSAEIAGACRANLNAARAMGDELSLYALLVRVALLEYNLANLERVTAQCKLPPDELRAIEKLLQREIDAPKLLAAMRGERTIGLNVLEAIRQGRIDPWPAAPGNGGFRDWIAKRLPRSRSVDRAGYLRAMNEMVEAGKLPVEQQHDEIKRVSDAWTRRDPATWNIMPSTEKLTQADAHVHAKLRCALVALAAERYRQAEGFWPGSLEALVKAKYIDAVPLDPFDGKALRSRLLAGGFLVYSIGADRTDNGGVLNRHNPTASGADIGFQLWDVPFRGLPPPPER